AGTNALYYSDNGSGNFAILVAAGWTFSPLGAGPTVTAGAYLLFQNGTPTQLGSFEQVGLVAGVDVGATFGAGVAVCQNCTNALDVIDGPSWSTSVTVGVITGSYSTNDSGWQLIVGPAAGYGASSGRT